MKKQIFMLTILIFSSIASFGQIPDWSWAKNTGGTSADQGNSITTDGFGNVYLTGIFQSPIITFGSTTLTNAGSSSTRDIFIVKYDPSGNVLWAQRAGGSGDDLGNSITTDSLGNVYLTGVFKSSAITFDSTTLTNAGSNTRDIFIVKYGPSGNVLWAQNAGGSNDDSGNGINTDGLGNVYLTGSFQSPTIAFDSDTLTNAGSSDIFIAKYDSSGSVLWAQRAGGTGGDVGNSISTDPAGNGDVYLTGYFYSSTITFGSDTLTNTGSSDIFIVKYDSSGSVLWAKSAGGSTMDFSTGITTDSFDNVYLTGWFASATIIFGSDTLTNAGSYDIFIAKYDSSGNILWAQRAGGTGGDVGTSISTDSYGNIYLTGYFNSPAIIFGSDTLINAGISDIFITKYDSSGNVLWAKRAGGSNDDIASSITIDNFDNEYLTGVFKSSAIAFDSDTLTNAASGTGDIFIAKLSIADNNGPVCEGSSLSLTAYTVSGAIYSWSGPDGYTSSLQNPTVSDSATTTMTGIYSVTVTIGGNAIATGSTNVAVNPMPSVPVITPGGSTIFCQGDSVILTSSIANSYIWSDSATTQSITILDSGSYTVTIFDSIGCAATSLPTIVTVYSNPDTPTVTQPGDSLQSSAATTYQWYLNGIIIGGATSQVYIPTQNGDYTVEITDSNGCSAVSLEFNYTYVGINEMENENLIVIFPNPTSSNFTITIPPATRQIKIFNSVGQLLSRTCGIEGQTNVNLTLTNNGVYFIQIITDKEAITKKIIVCVE